jgi:hypothetical protein
MKPVEIHGYAIISDDNCIADATGATPPALRSEADWAYFQQELDRSDVTVLGRLGHEANANTSGRLAVPGGRRVFDLFLAFGYHAFHLTRAEGVLIPGGTPVFSACAQGESPEAVLAARGLAPDDRQVLDPAGPVTLTVWRRTSATDRRLDRQG